ncbi:MAG: hypothetical protein JWM95_602 [Gemmatimonadetes bacterium]|nr:hypothetical protein [Gemmatimonadota bacterium]
MRARTIRRHTSGNATAVALDARISHAGEAPTDLYALKLPALWQAFRKQRASFWCMTSYLFFEYVRPQQIYERLPNVPYNKICLVLGAIFFVAEGRRIQFGKIEVGLLLFSIIVVASSAAATFPQVSFDHLMEWFNWVIIYILVSNTVDSEVRFLVFVFTMHLWNLKMSVHGTKSWAQDGFAFRDWGTGGAPGFFQNSGEFGLEMCIFLAMLAPWILSLRRYWSKWKFLFWIGVATTAITGIAGSSSRGAILGAGAIVGTWLLRSRQKVRTLVLAVLVVGFVYVIMPPEARARYSTMGNDATSLQRKTFWKQGMDMMQESPALGIGYKNWMDVHRMRYPGTEHIVQHNIFVEIGSELGIGSILVFLFLVGCTAATNRKTRQMLKERPRSEFMIQMAFGLDAAMISYLVAGFFVTVFYYPFFWINLALTVGLHRAALASTVRSARRDVAPRALRPRSFPLAATPT